MVAEGAEADLDNTAGRVVPPTSSLGRRLARAWAAIRYFWPRLGALAGVIFTVWSLLAFRAQPAARLALRGDERVAVTHGDGAWTFRPRQASEVGLLFFPGALVEPAAYAPIARGVADRGYVVLLIEMPWRGGFGGADSPQVFERAHAAMAASPDVRRWVAAGHSRGGVVAARFVHGGDPRVAGLVLIGTSHPRDFSLADRVLPITRVFGTRDTVADVEKLDATRGNLPPATRMVRIDGGNHSQFGQYGFQPGDWPATIDRDTQQRITRDAVLATLAEAAGMGAR